jgi:hypothetical protein
MWLVGLSLLLLTLTAPAANGGTGEGSCQLPSSFTVNSRVVSLPRGSASSPPERTEDGMRTNDTWIATADGVEALRTCTLLDGGGAWQQLRFKHTTPVAEGGGGAGRHIASSSPSSPLTSVNVFSGFIEGNFDLFYSIGSSGQPTDFAPQRVTLTPGVNVSLAPFGGRSSDQALPMFHLIAKDPGQHQSVWIGIGWTGTWRLELAPAATGVHVSCGQNDTHLQLLPGESFRTPSVLVLPYSGDAEQGFNRWRRLIREHFTPRQPGTREPVLLPTAMSFASIPFEDCNETNQILAIENTAKYFKPAGVDTYWIDAGWQGVFPASVGNWTPNTTRFPNGLGPVGAAATAAGVKMLLWFEPERVMHGTELWNQPELYTTLPPAQCRLCDQDPTQPCGLLNLAKPEARIWVSQLN